MSLCIFWCAVLKARQLAKYEKRNEIEYAMKAVSPKVGKRLKSLTGSSTRLFPEKRF
jgi:hypothetical protein